MPGPQNANKDKGFGDSENDDNPAGKLLGSKDSSRYLICSGTTETG